MSVSLRNLRPLPYECSASLGDFMYRVSAQPRFEVNFDRPPRYRGGLDLLVSFDCDFVGERLVSYLRLLRNCLANGGFVSHLHSTESSVFGFKRYFFRICIFC